jgi:hypothetical protein
VCFYSFEIQLLSYLCVYVSIESGHSSSRTCISRVMSDLIPWFTNANRFTKTRAVYGLFYRPPLPVLLPATSGQGLQISGQLTRREGKVFYNLKFENHTQIPLDKFMIQFNKNTFGLAAGGPLQVHVLICLKFSITRHF